MAVEKLKIRLDAAQILPRPEDQAIYQQISIRDTQAQAIKERVWVDPIQTILMIEPLQFRADAYLDSDIIRNGKLKWILTDSHWDEVVREQEKWLLSDGTAEEIETLTIFPKNAGFYLKFQAFGTRDDLYKLLTLGFGQWYLDIFADGIAVLRKAGEAGNRASGNIAGANRHKLTDDIVELVIMPIADGRLYIRRNGVAGFVYTLPHSERATGNTIEKGPFTLQAPNSRIRFELTQLRWPDIAVDSYYITPNFKFTSAPAATQEIHKDAASDIPGSGGVAVGVYDAHAVGAVWADLAVFVPDGVKTDYCVGFILVGDTSHDTSPMILGGRVYAYPSGVTVPTDPTDVSADVTRLSISTGDSAMDTTVTLMLREPDSHPILGAANRLCKITAGVDTIFIGVLKEPPKYTRTNDGHREFECVAQGLAKYLNEQCLRGTMLFDGVSHTEAVKWLCYAAGLVDADMEFDVDATALSDTRKQTSNGDIQSELQPDLADTPIDWIERIYDITGWRFTDGYSIAGDYVLKYIDPLSLSTASAHTFYMDSADETDPEGYQRIHEWRADSVEPEANEVYIYGPEVGTGRLIAGRYRDSQSQDPTTPDGSRPDNWLGIPRILAAGIDRYTTQQEVEGLALRIGQEVCEQRYFARFEADYPLQLWKNDVVTVVCTAATKEPGIGATGTSYYRITGIRNIDCQYEAADIPVRRAQYEAVKIGDLP